MVKILDRLLQEMYGIDAVKVRTFEVLTEGGKPGVVYRFHAQGMRFFLAIGLMRIMGDPSETPVPALFLECAVVMIPDDWSVVLDLLGRRFLHAGGSKLAILDEGECLGLDLLLSLMNYPHNKIEAKVNDFFKSIGPTQAEIFSRYPDLQPVAVGTRRT